MTGGLDVQTHVSDHSLFVTLVGEYDLTMEGALHTQAEPLLTGGIHSVILDLTRLTYCDSTGLRDVVLLRRASERAGMALSIYVAKGSVIARVIHWMGFDTMVRVVEVPEDVGLIG
ncbi:MAG TPA: STAS domain-containing protein [Armatimonadota bacterium]|jgi:anti-anti-sigma factor